VISYLPVARGKEFIDQKIYEYAETAERIWYIQCREWDVDPERLVISALSKGSEQTESWEFPGVRVFLFRLPAYDLEKSDQ